MLNVLNNQGQTQNDAWQLVDDASVSDNNVVPLAAAITAALDLSTLKAVVIDTDTDPQQLPQLAHCDLIAVNFPRFVDGQGYSLARILREDLAYQGELRAVGDVRCDQLADLHRCGFSSFALNEDQDLELAQRALTPLAQPYQADAVQSSPLFRRR